MSQVRLVLLASGNGSIAQSIIDAVSDKALVAQIVGLICDQENAHVLQRAKSAGIPQFLIPMKSERNLWDIEVATALEELNPDLVVSAGFMRVLSSECVKRFKIVNSHPALLPLFPGAHAVRDALAAGVKESGTTIHWLDAGIDTGQIIAQESVAIIAGDTEESLHERIKIVERRLFVATLQSLLADHVRS